MRNTFAPINRIPPDVLSLIPDYWGHRAEKDTIVLTHVCHGWREIFTSRSSLWTHLDCRSTEKTRVYIERSRSHPLEISLTRSKCISYCNDALLIAVPHIGRLGSLTISVPSNTLSHLFVYFPFPAPFLKELKIDLDIPSNHTGPDPVIPSTIFPDHLSPLHKLSLSGVVTDLPWRNLSNLTVFEFRHVPHTVDPLFMGQLLDFLESAPLLRKISLRDSIPNSFTVPPGRAISLLDLEKLIVHGLPAHSTFLNHLHIPTGASLDLRFSFSAGGPLIPVCLPNNFGNHNITTINLLVNTPPWTRMRLDGPSGELRACGNLRQWDNGSFFRSLARIDLSRTRKLSVAVGDSAPWKKFEDSPIFQTLLLTKGLHTLTLVNVDNLPFICALNPGLNESHITLCPELKELVIYIIEHDRFLPERLMAMASERAKRFSKLQSITIINLGGHDHPREEVFSLREYISRVEYKWEFSLPHWDAVFEGRAGHGDYSSGFAAILLERGPSESY